jgi:hypothetical protein
MATKKFEPFSKVDNVGNMLKMYFYKETNTSRIALQLVKENRERELGMINHETKTLHLQRQRKVHLFLKLNAYGFNYTLINDKMVKKISVRDEFALWEFSPKYLIKHGQIMNFKNSGGFELQIFLPLKLMDKFKVY